jgi:hypothetical protein
VHFRVQKAKKNRSNEPYGSVLSCFKLLQAIFRNFRNNLRILVIFFYFIGDFLERVGGRGIPLFWPKG